MVEALSWYRRAADKGHADALTRMGNLYQTGMGVLQDYKTAASYYRKAVDSGSANACFFLSQLYNAGIV